MVKKLEEMHKDFFKEMANIGAGNATSLLFKLIGKEVSTAIPKFDMIPAEDIPKIFRVSERLVVVQYASIGGDEFGGNLLIVFPRESALSLVNLLQKRDPKTTEWLSDEDQDILKLVSMWLVRCYLDAIKGFLNIGLQPSELRIVYTFGETIGDLIDLALKKMTKQVFYLKTEFSVKPNIEGNFYFLFDESLSSFLLEKAEEMFGNLGGGKQ
jgi:chemotaxis protein CheC